MQVPNINTYTTHHMLLSEFSLGGKEVWVCECWDTFLFYSIIVYIHNYLRFFCLQVRVMEERLQAEWTTHQPDQTEKEQAISKLATQVEEQVWLGTNS